MASKENNNDSLLARWKKREKSNIAASTIDKAPDDVKIPLSSAQKRLWFLQQLYPNSSFYNYSEAYTFYGELNQNILKQAIQKVIESHDILRSNYHLENNETYQSISADSDIKFIEHDLSNLSENLANLEAQKIIENESKRAFNLSGECLIRPCLIKLNSNQHILQLTMHHIITDEWTMKLFREALSENYIKLLNDGSLDETKDQLQYIDYAYWENKQLISNVQLDYWKDKLSGELPVLNLPSDFPRPVQTNFKGAISKTEDYGEAFSQKFLDLGKKLGTTPFVLMLSVYYVFLNRCSGEKDLLVGSPITLRDNKLTESLFGFFLNTLVLRMTLDKNIPFDEFVANVRKNTLDAFKNKTVPFGELVKALNVERTLSTNPFFQVMFIYNEEIVIPDFGDGLEVSHRFLDPEVSKFDLTIFITEKKGILSTTFEYSTELFKESTIERFQSYFKTLLEDVVTKPHEKIFNLNMMPKEERATLLDHPPSISNKLSNFNGIHEAIINACQETPNSIAVTFNNHSITYKQLNDKANFLSLNLLQHLKKRNEVVGLCIDRSVEMIVGMLAILKTGCAYLPIDPEYPEDRIAFMIEDAGVNTVITEHQFESLFSESNLILLNHGEIEKVHDPNQKVSFPNVESSDLAYIIYTSGSTGKPKGVPISHQNIINSTNGRLDFYDENPKAFLLMSSISFDSSKAGIFWTLCTSGNLIVAEKRLEQDIAKIGSLIYDYNVTHTLMLPSLYNLILQHLDCEKLNSLNTVIVAGEACSKSLLANHFKYLPKVNLYNEYGPTEATVWCIAQKLEREHLQNVTIPIGKPVANAKVYILDELQNPVPFGCVGEIYIGSPSLTSGYINRPHLNKDVFFENPFNSDEKIYRTGDLGRFSNNKIIEFLGRADQQIKIRGFRVELNEIEKVIKSYSNNIKNTYVLIEDEAETKNLENNKNTDASSNLGYFLEQLDENDLVQIISSIEDLGKDEKKYLLKQLEVKRNEKD